MRKKIIQLNLLTLSILYAQHGFALQELEDSSLSQISGQDGISLQIDATKVQIGQVNWKDSTQTSAGANSVLNVNMSNIETTPYKSDGLKAAFTADVGGKPGASAAASNGLRLNAVFGPATMNIKSLAVCPNGAGITANCSGANSQSLGGLTFQNRKDLTFSLETQSGLFNGGSLASLGFGLKNANLFYTLDTGSSFNQLILKDFNFNFAGNGYLYLDPADGLVLSTNKKGETSSANTVVLGDVDDPDFSGKKQPGLNVDLRYKTNVGSDYKAYQATGKDTDILSFGRIGASGTLKNAYIKVNGDTPALGASTTNIGTAATGTGNLAGSGGLHMQMKADFAKDTANAADQKTYFDLGLSGKNAYVLRYGNLTPLQIRKDTGIGSTALNNDLAFIDFGHVYINAAQTNTVNMPISALLNRIYSGSFTPTTLKTALHYNTTGLTNPNALIATVRGMSFQAVARQGRFVADNSVTAPVTNTDNSWGLGLPIYNLNANLGLYGIKATANTKQSLGFGLSMSTEGRNSTGTYTTSIMLIDGAKNPFNANETVNYYAGLRNINLLADLTGTLSFENNGLSLSLPKIVAALDTELAIGQLPGSLIVTDGCKAATTIASNCFVPSNNFTQTADVLFGISARIDGSATLTVTPSSGDGLGINGNIVLYGGSSGSVPRNYLRISDKSGSTENDSPSQLGIDNLSGQLNLDSKIGMNATTTSFTNNLRVNSSNSPAYVLKADVNLYPKVSGTPTAPAVLPTAQTLGQMVMTGGNIRSTFGITPR